MNSEKLDWETDFPHDYAHAVGVFALYYNVLELAVFGIFQRYAPGDIEIQASLFSMLNNQERREFISGVVSTKDSIAAAGAVMHAMKCFELCSENRNLLLHAAPMYDPDVTETFTMAKMRRKNPHMMAVYDFTVEDIRVAADSNRRVEEYVVGILRYFEDFSRMESLEDLPELPDEPPLPRRLDLSLRMRDE